MPAFTTISSASQARFRDNATPHPKAAPRPAAAQREQQQAHADRQAEIDAEAAAWWAYTTTTVKRMAEKFDKKERYFWDLLLQGGAHLVHHREGVNAYNAFKHEKALQNHEAGVKEDVEVLHEAHFDEYQQMSEEDKAALVERHRVGREGNFVLRRDSPRASAQDVANLVRNMKMLLGAGAKRVGLEGFFCIVRSTTRFGMEPVWHFTNAALEEYMPIVTRKPWNTGDIGFKLEAFAIAGCEVSSLLRTSKQKSEWLKGEIRAQVKRKMVEATGNDSAEMAYVWYEEDVVQKYNVVVEGWVGIPFANPSTASTSLPNLRTTADALKAGTIKFRKISATEAAERKKQWEDDVREGRAVAKHQAERKDKGQPRPHTRKRHSADKGGSGDDVEDTDDESDAERPAKRRKTASASAAKAKAKGKGKENVAGPSGKKAKKGTATRKAPGRDDAVTRAAKARLRKPKSAPVVQDSDSDT